MGDKKKFSKAELKLFLSNENSCINLVKGTKHISLHPYFLDDVENGIKDNLNKLIFHYDKTLKGIILAYRNVKLLESKGKIYNDTGFVYIDVEADFYLFTPEENKVLEAIVNKKSEDHVGCLAHKEFNISIPRPPKEAHWLGKFVNIGDKVLIRINLTDVLNAIPYIRGEIIQVLTKSNDGNTTNLFKKSKLLQLDSIVDSMEVDSPEKIGKKEHTILDSNEVETKKKKHTNSLVLANDTVDGIKVKKHKSLSAIELDVQQMQTETSPPKKKKKRKDISLDFSTFKEQLEYDGINSTNVEKIEDKVKVKKHKKSTNSDLLPLKTEFRETDNVDTNKESPKKKHRKKIDNSVLSPEEIINSLTKNLETSTTFDIDKNEETPKIKHKKMRKSMLTPEILLNSPLDSIDASYEISVTSKHKKSKSLDTSIYKTSPNTDKKKSKDSEIKSPKKKKINDLTDDLCISILNGKILDEKTSEKPKSSPVESGVDSISKKPKKKKKQYQSLQMEKPQYEHVVPTNETSKFNEMISDKYKMKKTDTSTTSDAESTKKYPTPNNSVVDDVTLTLKTKKRNKRSQSIVNLQNSLIENFLSGI